MLCGCHGVAQQYAVFAGLLGVGPECVFPRDCECLPHSNADVPPGDYDERPDQASQESGRLFVEE